MKKVKNSCLSCIQSIGNNNRSLTIINDTNISKEKENRTKVSNRLPSSQVRYVAVVEV